MTKPRKLGKRQLERANLAFNEAVDAELQALGAVWDGAWYWRIETKAGPLVAKAIPSVSGPGGFVALRFQDVERAVRFLHPDGIPHFGGELNTYSGKWNLHLYDEPYGESGRELVRLELRRKLTRVLPASDENPIPTVTETNP